MFTFRADISFYDNKEYSAKTKQWRISLEIRALVIHVAISVSKNTSYFWVRLDLKEKGRLGFVHK